MWLNGGPPSVYTFTLQQIESGQVTVAGSKFPPDYQVVIRFWQQGTDPAMSNPVTCNGTTDDSGNVQFPVDCTTTGMGSTAGAYEWQAVDFESWNPISPPYLFDITS